MAFGIARDQVVLIDYTNYRGERSVRRVLLSGAMIWTSNEYHPEPQWLMPALDIEKGTARQFAMKDIHSWRTEE